MSSAAPSGPGSSVRSSASSSSGRRPPHPQPLFSGARVRDDSIPMNQRDENDNENDDEELATPPTPPPPSLPPRPSRLASRHTHTQSSASASSQRLSPYRSIGTPSEPRQHLISPHVRRSSMIESPRHRRASSSSETPYELGVTLEDPAARAEPEEEATPVLDDQDALREVYFNYAPGNAVFAKCSNTIVTSKYTVLSFLPKFIFESFSKVANLFFLAVSILQTVKDISNTYGYPTNSPTLLFVISIDACFAIMEDVRRHRSDRASNSAIAHVVRDGKVQDITWAQVKVGDFLVIRNREVVPADVLILSVAEPAGEAASGICYVETKSLDGETNLKLRQAIPATMGSLVNPEELMQLRGVIKCEQPNPYINKFAGKIEVTVSEGCGMEVTPISDKNVLLRGCNLRNTDWVYGVVVNTGPDTKIMQSASSAPSKWSDLMLSINRMIGIICLLLFSACALAALFYVTFQYKIVKNTWYIPPDNYSKRSRIEEFIRMLFYYFLLLYQVIPISLYVSMTTVKFLQARFITWDKQLYHEETDTPALVRTMDLNEELGQISYVFTDKTGTLTCNIMEFRKCSINGVSYGSGLTEIGRAAMLRAGRALPPEPKLDRGQTRIPFVNFVDPALFEAMKGRQGEEQKAKILQFFEHLAVCHTVIPERMESGEVRLSASSPDEQALVAGAAFIGFKFENRGVGRAVVNVFGERVTYEILDVLEFNSTRKRMSVVVRRPQGQLMLYTKGADMMIYQRLRDDQANDMLKKSTRQHMEQYADDGLRTLALAVKPLDEKWYAKWKVRFDEAQGSVSEIDRRKDGKPNAIDDLMEEIENGLELIGATAIEDKLQDGVPKCLEHLTQAGIKVWMLTGDKEETAINIGYACSLLDNSVQQVIVNCTNCPSEEAIRMRLRAAVKEYKCHKQSNAGHELALIIDGEALVLALRPTTAPALLGMGQLCRAVICNRVSPAQKAEMVALVRDHITGARTLAIGDGANDVAMIQQAHVGVGISGQEGMQAVNSSDYAIAQFRFLERLLLVHGRWNYLRISKLVLYMFYKNMTLVLAQYWYTYFSGASGSKMYWELGVQVYNVLFTCLPIIVVGVLDKDLPDHFSIDFPQLYRRGPERAEFNYYTFFRWIGAALFESLVIFMSMALGFNASEHSPGSESRVEFGMVAFTLAVLIVNLKICLMASTWNWLLVGSWWISVLSWFAFAAIGTEVPFFGRLKIGFDEFGAFAPTASSSGTILLIVITCAIALGRHCAWNQYQRIFYPDAVQVLQESIEFSRHRLTLHDLEQQALSMTLDLMHATQLTNDIDHGATIGSGVNMNMSTGPAMDMSSRKPSEPPMLRADMASSPDESIDNAMELPEMNEARSGSTDSLPVNRSFSTSVFSHVVQTETRWESIGSRPFQPSLNRRNTGFAFSFDEETTLAESYIASNSLPRAEAVPAALRNSVLRNSGMRSSSDDLLTSI